jgi:hypothetical protein
MHMLYNSDNFVVVRFDVVAENAATSTDQPSLVRGGYEIVDKFARKEIYIEGALADRFQQGVQALVEQGPDEEALDEFIGGFTTLAQHPVTLH